MQLFPRVKRFSAQFPEYFSDMRKIAQSAVRAQERQHS
jgi:hypothetical protein